MKIKILYNNTAKEGFKSGWGFSCLIENDKKVLFDTGADFKTLKHNADKLDVDFKDTDIVVISHKHFDHTGGLNGFLKENANKAKVIWPDKNKSFEISQNIYSTGALSSGSLGIFSGIKEQSLFIKTKKGLVVLVGCSHPGVDKILQKVREINNLKDNKEIYAIMGGFHGFNKLEELKDIKFIGACHCTQHKKEIKEKYPKNYKEINAGDIIEI